MKDDAGNAYFLHKDGSRLGDKSYNEMLSHSSESLAAVADEYLNMVTSALTVQLSFLMLLTWQVLSWRIAAVGKSENEFCQHTAISMPMGSNWQTLYIEDARDFQMGAARVKVGDKYGLIDRFW